MERRPSNSAFCFQTDLLRELLVWHQLLTANGFEKADSECFCAILIHGALCVNTLLRSVTSTPKFF